MKILLAEDSATSRYVVQSAVERLGHECEVAEDGLQAWNALARYEPDVVISDWEMPVMDGEELCRRIREDPDGPYTYFIMLTALEDRAHVLRGMQAGADDYLTKPLEPYELEMRLIAASRVTELHRRIRRRQEETEQEIALAARVQSGLLPDAAPRLPGVLAAGACYPAANVGGDCFDYVADDRGRLVAFIADVAGHSISSALLMAMGRSTLRREIASGAAPAEVLAAANRALFRDLLTAELFITMFCARYDPATRELSYANAGHNPPLLRRGGEVLELDAEGAAVGLLDEVDFEQRELVLGLGDRLLLYTDGVTEALDAAGEPFGEERLQALVRGEADVPPEALVEGVYAAVRAHAGAMAQADDITLVALQAVAR